MSDLSRCNSDLIASHEAIHAALEHAWNAAIVLLREPDDLERYAQCSAVAAFLRDAYLHIRREDDVVFENARRAGFPSDKLEQFRAEHAALCTAMASLPPLLDNRRTLDDAAVRILRLVARFEQHLEREQLAIDAH